VEVERAGTPVPVMKSSPGKATRPGRKQVWRVVDGGAAVEDVIELADAPPPAAGATAEPLLTRVMRAGRREEPPLPTVELRARCLAALEVMPQDVRRLEGAARYPVRIGTALRRAIDALA
jgi:nicotinate phosphoribosyltransferase